MERLVRQRVDSLDLLFVIDDSRSMGDKQRFMADALPTLVDTLVAEMPAIDIHVGIITSSLGGHGADACSKPEENGHAELAFRDGAEVLPTYHDLGFLFWDPTGEEGGDTDPATFASKLSAMVLAPGDEGCGYEAPLEAWYRFLVEPSPHESVVVEKGQAVLQGTDEVLLAQRRAFLRPDSLVAIVMLTDENDCSIRDGGQYFFALEQVDENGAVYHLPKPRAACASDPNDPCCRSCGQGPGAGCSEALDDCAEPLSNAEDPPHLRCFDQKRRFGIDFMWPTDRYVAGLTQFQVMDRYGNVADNPLFVDLVPNDSSWGVRGPDMVFLAGVVGVPWQDLARRGVDGLPDPKAGLQTASEMRDGGTWGLILGDPTCYHTDGSCLPSDPLMRESVAPRSGTHPITGDALSPPGSPSLSNPINGHERDLFDELQYACIMPLPEPRDCAAPTADNCPCADPNNQDPQCQDESGAYTQVQRYTGAMPGIRELQVLEALGDQGIVGSACAAPNPDTGGFGYASSLAALGERVVEAMGLSCLPRKLEVDAQGRVACTIVEARTDDDCEAACAEPGRRPFADERVVDALRQDPTAAGTSCFCELEQLDGRALQICRDDASADEAQLPVDGWCYVDAEVEPPVGNPAVVAACPAGDRRQLRFVGEAIETGPSFIFCGDIPTCR
ncbi:MAG: hypothetical protein R3B72_07105 [Polyangiaceae bacterium]